MYLFLSNMECSIYSWTYLVLDGLLQNRSHLPASLPQLSQLRRQISGCLDYSASASSRENILTTVSILTFMSLFCLAKALTQSTLDPQQLVSVQRFWTLCCSQIHRAQRPSMSEIQLMVRDMLPHRDSKPFFLSHPCVLTQLSIVYRKY
jgi:hypothetical protein